MITYFYQLGKGMLRLQYAKCLQFPRPWRCKYE